MQAPPQGAVSFIAEMFGVDYRRLSSGDESFGGSESRPPEASDSKAVADVLIADSDVGPVFPVLLPPPDDSRPVTEVESAELTAEPPKVLWIEPPDLQKKIRKHKVNGAVVDRKGRPVGVFVPMPPEVSDDDIRRYRESVLAVEEHLVIDLLVFPFELIKFVPLEPFDV